MSQPFPGTALPTNTSLYLPLIVTLAVSPLRLLLLHFLVSMACCELEKYLPKKTVELLNDTKGSLFLCLFCSTPGSHPVCQFCLSCSILNVSESLTIRFSTKTAAKDQLAVCDQCTAWLSLNLSLGALHLHAWLCLFWLLAGVKGIVCV